MRVLDDPPSAEPIDAVYTFTDGSDPTWQHKFEACLARLPAAPDAAAVHRARFRDNGELRYSLRSIERYAPWIRQVFLVVDEQAPAWLVPTHPRLTVIRHETIFADPQALPTFNSNAIEWQLCRIPGLSRRFLYFNDDLFLGQPVTPSTWLLPSGGQMAFFENNPILHVGVSAPVHDRAYAHTLGLLDRVWRRRRYPGATEAYTGRWRDRLWFPLARRMLPAHVPQLFDRQILERLGQMFAGPVGTTSRHRFRAGDDFVVRLAYFYYLLEASPAAWIHQAKRLDGFSSEFLFVRLLDGTDTQATLHAAANRPRPRFLCLNDDINSAPERHPVLAAARALLAAQHPQPSSFERF